MERSRALRPQIRAADLPGKSPVGRGAHGKLRAAAWKVRGFICSTDTFCVQAHLSQQNRGIEEHDGSGNIHRYEYSWQAAAGSRLKLSSVLFVFGSILTNPHPQLCAAWGAQRDGWPRDNKSTGQTGISAGLKAANVFFCVCPAAHPLAQRPSHPLLGWAGPGGSLISWEGKPGPGPWNRADLLGLPLIF